MSIVSSKDFEFVSSEMRHYKKKSEQFAKRILFLGNKIIKLEKRIAELAGEDLK